MALKKRLFRDMAPVGGATAAPTTSAPVANPSSSGEIISEQTKALEATNDAKDAAEDLQTAKDEAAVMDASAAAAVTIGSCFGPWGTLVGGLVAGGIEVTKEFTVNKDLKEAEVRYADATAAAADAAAKAKAASDKIAAANAAKNQPDPVQNPGTVEQTPGTTEGKSVVAQADVGNSGSNLATAQVDAQNGAIAAKTSSPQVSAPSAGASP